MSDDDLDIIGSNSANPSADDAQKKSKVGRPRSNRTDQIIPQLGVVQQPSNYMDTEDDLQSRYVAEIEYDCTTLIGKLFELIERICVNELYFYFTHNGLSILTNMSGDIKGIADTDAVPGEIYVDMPGNKANLYYVDRPFTIMIIKNHITRRLISPSKHFNSIKFAITQQAINSSNSTMDIRMLYTNNRSEDCISVPFMRVTGDMQSLRTEQFQKIYNYPLRFRASVNYMKIVITTAQTSLIKYINFYYHEKKFEILHKQENKGVDKTTVFKGLEKINFIHDGEEDSIISATLDQKILSDIIGKDIADMAYMYIDGSMPIGLEFNLEQETQVLNNVKDKFYINGSEKIKVVCLVKQFVATSKPKS